MRISIKLLNLGGALRPPAARPRAGLLAVVTLALIGLTVACSSEWSAADLPRADWRNLADLDIRTGEITPTLEALLGPEVKIPGFVVPFEDSLTSASTFLLVPNFGACIHLPPPSANQMVMVEMNEGQQVAIDLWSEEPIWVVGNLRVTESDSPWGAVGFSMKAQATLPFADGLGEDETW